MLHLCRKTSYLAVTLIIRSNLVVISLMENFTLLPSSRDVVSAMCTSNRSAFLPLNPAVVRKARVRAGRVGRMGRKRRVEAGQVYLRLTHVQEPRGSNLMLSEKVSKLTSEGA